MKKIIHTYPSITMEETECSETSAYKMQMPRITQKKAYNIQSMAKVWNQEYLIVFKPQIMLRKFHYLEYIMLVLM